MVSAGSGTAPAVSRLGPNAVVAGGGAFQLVVIGSNFDSNSVIQWDGLPQPTGFVSSTLLTTSISAADIATSAIISVTVANFDPAGTTVSNTLTFSISASAVPATFFLSTQAVSASDSTSLGGGGILNNPAAIIVNGSSSATYYYSISFTGSAVAGMVINGETGITSGITIPSGPAAGRITGEPSPGLGQTITGAFTGPVDFIDQIMLVTASTLGAGTYVDTITVKVCTDAHAPSRSPAVRNRSR